MKSFCFISSKDVRLPVQLQRAMAAEAEAAREARAKVCLSVLSLLFVFVLSGMYTCIGVMSINVSISLISFLLGQ